MNTRLRVLLLAVCCIATVGAPCAQQRSPRNANYTIDVRLDTQSKTLSGRQTLSWTNLQFQPTTELWFHLYWNGWRNSRSSWMLEDRIRGRSGRDKEIDEQDWGRIDVESISWSRPDRMDSGVEPAHRFAAPDDGNEEDRTVLVVSLPEAVWPGETIELEMSWSAKIPRTVARTGYRGNFYFLAHWFPKLAVYEADGWNCHQFHASTEFYSDYGIYDVTITVPGEMVVGATGRERARSENEDGSVTLQYYAEDVHGFAWTASPDFIVREATFDEPGLPSVEMRLLIQPEHLDQSARHFEATRAALSHYGRWYGPYPYGQLTIVDPAYGSGAGGMEYPTLFTCGTRLFNPPGGDSPEGVTIHEAGHQFWYGLVGNNEFEHAWIDEGLNTFSTIRTLDAAYPERILVQRYLKLPGAGRRVSGAFALPLPEIPLPRVTRRFDSYRRSAGADVPATPSFQYFPGSAADITYSKTALWLMTLERYIGWERLREILSTFFERHRFGHPTAEDFFAVVNELTDEDLGWFVRQVHEEKLRFDYAVESVASFPAALSGYTIESGESLYLPPPDGEESEQDATSTDYRSEVIVQRRAEGVFPVELLLVFEDGAEIRHSWDGRESWKLFVEERASKLRYAAVDPERTLLLDVDFTNNSLLREPAAALPARKWSSKWMIWLQDLLLHFSFFV